MNVFGALLKGATFIYNQKMEKKQKEVKRTRYQKVSKSPTQDINDKEVIMNTRKRSPDKYQQPQQTLQHQSFQSSFH